MAGGSSRIRTRIGIDRDLYQKGKELGLDFSKLLEYSIRRILEALETPDFEKGVDRAGFEPAASALQARRSYQPDLPALKGQI